MQKVAFVTYNSVGKNLPSGWHGQNGRQALVLQNSKGERWAVNELIGRGDVPPDYERRDAKYTDLVKDEIGNLWVELQKALPELDHIVVYVGSSGSELAIQLASQLPAEKITLVGCHCGLPKKEAMVQTFGLGSCRRMLCECGGQRTMGQLFGAYMATGELAN